MARCKPGGLDVRRMGTRRNGLAGRTRIRSWRDSTHRTQPARRLRVPGRATDQRRGSFRGPESRHHRPYRPGRHRGSRRRLSGRSPLHHGRRTPPERHPNRSRILPERARRALPEPGLERTAAARVGGLRHRRARRPPRQGAAAAAPRSGDGAVALRSRRRVPGSESSDGSHLCRDPGRARNRSSADVERRLRPKTAAAGPGHRRDRRVVELGREPGRARGRRPSQLLHAPTSRARRQRE